MRRLVEKNPGAVPPPELVDNRKWCAARSTEPFGHVLAVAQWQEWRSQRQAWAAAHGTDDDGDPPLRAVGDGPFDWGLI